MVQVLTPKILPTILTFCTMFESVCFFWFYTFIQPLTFRAVLTPYLPKLKVRKEKNLLNKNGEVEEEVEEVCQTEIYLFNPPLSIILA